MNIYHFHPGTGVYCGAGLADESPLEPGVWLIPAWATTIEPLPVEEGEQAVWNGTGWVGELIPEPEPEPEPQIVEPVPTVPLTPVEKLAAAGLTVEELKALLN